MKKLFTLVLTLTLALSLAACGGAKKTDSTAPGASTENKETTAKTHLDEIKAAGKIVLGTSADYPPYEFHKTVDGKDTYAGWEMDLAKAIAQDLGVTLEIKDLGFEGLIGDLNAQKVDFVIAAMTITEKRAQSVDFSMPYWKGGQVLLMKPDKAAAFKSVADLNGKTIGVQLGSTGEEEAKKIAGAKVKPLEKFEAAVLDLMSGRVDAVACDYTVGRNYEMTQGLKIVHSMSSEQTGIAFRKGDKELIEAVNKSLDKLIKDGSIDKMVKVYSEELK